MAGVVLNTKPKEHHCHSAKPGEIWASENVGFVVILEAVENDGVVFRYKLLLDNGVIGWFDWRIWVPNGWWKVEL
jgi:hypothetical protein